MCICQILSIVMIRLELSFLRSIIILKLQQRRLRRWKDRLGAQNLMIGGIIQKGLIVRHLIMPNYIQNTKGVLKWFKENLDDNIFISVMSQYFPSYKANEYLEINRKISKEEYEEIEDYIEELGIENGFMQDFSEDDEEKYVPNWDL